ncbi:hypothetical protein Back11_44060 [Paenibacillus baekrokdamisoli]|uniref:Uncharacterized protein n=1 Tax=Paenibacillus baekrokdamisoli TaxID=1712516 RepID=A0A3G9JB02_9BACL|nr:extracellular solute-binding protein [Paenibacillus baekrokdamisoli]MBB3067891.1 putative aldouronate transport system substrate-binding protein [Paenibacillus baekrokdamisoli]BBH23061.1 hypothetical protein Back11_44060 [Paenibacillus baekrokdamisoli]
MKKRIKHSVSLLIIFCLLGVILASCTGKSGNQTPSDKGTSDTTSNTATTDASKSLEPVTLKIMLWGDKPKQMDDVVAEFEKQTKDTLNTKLEITWTPQADYNNKLKLKMSAGEQMDMVFDAPWMSLNEFVAKDNYFILDEFFNNDKYPGLKKAFSGGLLKNNEFIGPDNKPHVYGVPLTQNYGALVTLFYRKDLADKYGITSINGVQDLEKYFDAILKNEKNMIPFAERNDGNYSAKDIIDMDQEDSLAQAKAGLLGVPLAPNVSGTVFVKDNKVVNATVTGAALEEMNDFPLPFNVPDYSVITKTREWHDKGYTEKDPIMQKDPKSMFTSGKSAAYFESITAYDSVNGGLKSGVPSSELGMYMVSRNQRELKPESMLTDFRAWNFIAIPKSSKNLDRSMMFLNWLFADQANHDLFEFGVPGKNWIPVGDSKYSFPDGIDLANNYALPGYEFTWNPNYIRVPTSIPEQYIKYYQYQSDQKAYMKSPLAGFTFSDQKVKTQLANPDFAKVSSLTLPYTLGMIPDPANAMAKLQSKWEQNKKLQKDIKAIKAELISQVQLFLDNNKSSQ